MTTVRIIPTIPEHIDIMERTARPADVQEFFAANFHTPRSAIEMALRRGYETYSGFANDELVCIFGVIPESMMGRSGTPWLVSAAPLSKYKFTFLKECRKGLRKMLDKYAVLSNHIDGRQCHYMEWLRWLGFEISDKIEINPVTGVPFHRFVKRA